MSANSTLRAQNEETIDSRMEQAIEKASKECKKRLPQDIVPERLENLTKGGIIFYDTKRRLYIPKGSPELFTDLTVSDVYSE